MKSKHQNTHPYEWRVHKDDSHVCPECGIKPPWQASRIKIKSYEDLKGELSPDEFKRLYQNEWVEPDDYSVCPRCNENAFHSDGFQQDTDGQYSHRWSCENCKYTETL